jgi:hypothetical protein
LNNLNKSFARIKWLLLLVFCVSYRQLSMVLNKTREKTTTTSFTVS